MPVFSFTDGSEMSGNGCFTENKHLLRFPVKLHILHGVSVIEATVGWAGTASQAEWLICQWCSFWTHPAHMTLIWQWCSFELILHIWHSYDNDAGELSCTCLDQLLSREPVWVRGQTRREAPTQVGLGRRPKLIHSGLCSLWRKSYRCFFTTVFTSIDFNVLWKLTTAKAKPQQSPVSQSQE